jgi:hypothetical protein
MKWSFLLILLFGKCFSQNTEISIEANGQASDKREIYKVMLKDSTAHIIYFNRDSISKKFNTDKRIKKLFKKMDLKNPKDSAKVKEFENILESYSYYTKDTIKLSSKTVIELKSIISKIDETSTSDLEIKIPGTLWLMIDGTIYKLNIPYKGKNRVIWASKNKKRYPLLYELIDFMENIEKNSSL